MAKSALRDFNPGLIQAMQNDPLIRSLVGTQGVGSAVKQFTERADGIDSAWPWWIVVDDMSEVGNSTFGDKAWDVTATLRLFYRHGDSEKVSYDGVLKLYGAVAEVLDEERVTIDSGAGIAALAGKLELQSTQVDPDGRTTQGNAFYGAHVVSAS